MPRVVLVRHGESELNASNRHGEKYFGGQFDALLTDRGKQQARDVGKQLAGDASVGLRVAVSSTLGRAVETLRLIARELPPPLTILPPLESLNERSLGTFEGRAEAEVYREHPDYRDHPSLRTFRNDFQQRAPGGENLTDVSLRVWAAWQGLCHINAGDLLIVSHSKAIQAWLGRGLGLSPAEIIRVKIPNATPIFVDIPEVCDHTIPNPVYRLLKGYTGILNSPK